MREHRPVPLPPRGGKAPDTATAASRPPVPAGAARWSTVYVNDKGLPVRSDQPVPVDHNDRRTAHLRYRCPVVEKIDDGTKNLAKTRCGYEQWLEPEHKPGFCPEHGKQLEATEAVQRESRLPWAAMWRAVEPTARPTWFLVAMAAAGIGETTWQVNPAWPAAGVPMLAAGAYAGTRGFLTWRARRRGKIARGQRSGRRLATIRRRARYGAYLGASGGSWLALAASVDPHSLLGMAVWAAMPVVWAVGSAGWWRHVAALRNRPAATPHDAQVSVPDPVSVPDATPEQARADAEAWTREVTGTAVGLKHTRVDVSTWQADPGGRRMVIRASKGAITEDTMRQALPTIAAAFDVKRSAIGWVEEYEDSPRTALLLVQPESPLNDDVPGKPVDIVPVDDAVVHMGLRIDGSDLTTRLFQPGWGAPSRLILGTKGSGKTELIRRLLLVMLQARVLRPDGTPTRLMAPFLHDPKRGADYGAFTRAVEGFSIESDTLHMIVDALIREMNRRYDLLATSVWRDAKGREREGERPFDPTVAGPVISLFCDEFHENAKDERLLAKLEPMSRKMRAAGIEVNVGTHGGTIGDTGSQILRDMLAGGEAWLLRTTSGLNAALATGGQLVGDPRALPRIPGMLLQASGNGPTMQARAAYDDPETLYDLLYDDSNLPRFQPVDWPQESLEALGSEFVDWMRSCQTRPMGSPVPGVPPGLRPKREASAVEGADTQRSDLVLRTILLDANRPLGRSEIAEHPRWRGAGFNDSSTLTLAARKGEDAGWLRKVPGKRGVYELAAAAREQITLAAEESREPHTDAA